MYEKKERNMLESAFQAFPEAGEASKGIPEKYDYLRKSRAPTKDENQASERSRSRSCSRRRGRRSSFRDESDNEHTVPLSSLMKVLQQDNEKEEEEDSTLLLEDSSRTSGSIHSSRSSRSLSRSRQRSRKSDKETPLSVALDSLVTPKSHSSAEKEDDSLLMEGSSLQSRVSHRSRSRSHSRSRKGRPVKTPKSLMGTTDESDSEKDDELLLPGKQGSPSPNHDKKKHKHKKKKKDKNHQTEASHSSEDLSFEQACEEFLSEPLSSHHKEGVDGTNSPKLGEHMDGISDSVRSSRTKRMSACDFKDLSSLADETHTKPAVQQNTNNSLEMAKATMDAYESNREKSARKKILSASISGLGESMSNLFGRFRRNDLPDDESDARSVSSRRSRMIGGTAGHRFDSILLGDGDGSEKEDEVGLVGNMVISFAA